MSAEFDANTYWLKRGKVYLEEEQCYAAYHRVQERFLFDTLRKGRLPMQSILEVGCGFGRVTKLLAENYLSADIVALDISPDQLESARRNCAGIDRIRFEQFDLYSGAPFPGTNYDAAIAVEVLLHHPRTLVRSTIEKLSTVARYLINIDWSEAWPWKPPEHVCIHDYHAIYSEAGLYCATFLLPEKIDGMQQKLFIASKKMTSEMIHLMEMAEEATAAAEAPTPSVSSAARWAEQLRRATAEIIEIVPPGSAFILVNDDQWGNEQDFVDRRVIPFLEHEGRYWGPPENDATALSELERLRQAGASHMIFAWPSFWWLDYYSGLRNHLQTKFPCQLANERVVVFNLKS
jgi:SAM-dependent methyltransferase